MRGDTLKTNVGSSVIRNETTVKLSGKTADNKHFFCATY